MNDDLAKSFLEKFVEERCQLYYEAGEYTMFYYPLENRPADFVTIKPDGTEVTMIELGVGKYIRKDTAKRYPWMSVFSEENSEETYPSARYAWCFDEIDGTEGFLHRNDQFALVGGLIDFKKEEVIAVVMYRPTGYDSVKKMPKKDFYTAIKGSGTFLKSIYDDGEENKRPLKVSGVSELNKSKLVSSSKSANANLRDLLNHLPIKSYESVSGAAKKAEMILLHQADGLVRLPSQSIINPWDKLVEFLITEAGGRSTNFFNEEERYIRGSLSFEKGLVLDNGKFHDELIETSHRTLKDILTSVEPSKDL